MPGGRPTSYRPEYCELVIEMLGSGASLTEFCARVGIVWQTLCNWRDAHPEFLEALSHADMQAKGFWEKELREKLMLDCKVNAPLVKLFLANRFGWTDKVEVTGPNGGAIQVSQVPDTAQLAMSQVARLMIEHQKADEVVDAEVIEPESEGQQ